MANIDGSDAYQSFCEDYQDSSELQDAWNKYQDAYGEIDGGSLVDILVLKAMEFAIEYYKTHKDD